jgi:uncharacterized protein (TIGR03083 family)
VKESLKALHNSVAHLNEVIEKVGPDKYESSAYPTEWSIADTMSHIGSGAVILGQNFDNIVNGSEPDPDFNQATWDEWNAKAPAEQVTDALAADAALLDQLQMLDEAGRDAFEFSMGPFKFDFAGFVGMRLNEQALHTWDIEVTLDANAALAEDAAGVMLKNVPMFVGFASKPNGEVLDLHVKTTDPEHQYVLSFKEDSVNLEDNEHGGNVDLELPAESFVRLVAGRLDAKHTPHGVASEHLDTLRTAFPGF